MASNKIDCYLSASEDSYFAIESLRNQFKSDLYSFKCRNKKSEFLKEDHDAIKSSKLLVIYVTNDYFKTFTEKNEFDYAISLDVPKLCLCVSDFDATAKVSQKVGNLKEKLINLIIELGALSLLKLQIEDAQWKNEILKEIHEKIDELINPESKLNIEVSPNRPNIPDNIECLKSLSKINTNDLLFRGTLISSTKLAVISLDTKINKYYIAVYDLESTNNECKCYCWDYLKKPSLITSNKYSHVLVTDDASGDLFIFKNGLPDSSKKIKLFLEKYNDMTVDEETNNIYFVKSIGGSEIKIYYPAINQYDVIKINCTPKSIKVFQDKIFVVNICSLHIDQENGKIIAKTLGESSIWVLDKKSFSVILNVRLKEAFIQPWSIIVDNKSNIYTTLFKVNENKCIEKERYLCKIDEKGNILSEIKLNTKYLQNDMLYSNHIFYMITENNIIKYSINN